MPERARILVVDDDVTVLHVLHDTLAPHFAVEMAHSGGEALVKLASAEFAVLVADQRMPGLSGVELAARAKESQPHLVTVLLSAYTDPLDMIAAINRGEIFRFVRKPWEAADLLVTVRQAAERHRLSRDNARLVVELTRRLRAVEILKDVVGAAVMAQGAHPADVLLERLESVLDYDLAAAWVADAEGAASLKLRGRGLVPAGNAVELCDQMWALVRLAGGEPPAEAAVRLTVAAQLDPSRPAAPVLSQLQVPLKQGGRVVGVMAVQAFRADTFAEDAAELLDLLANGAASALARLRAATGLELTRMEEVLAALPDGVLVVDAAGKVSLANRAARRLCEGLGLSGARLLAALGTSPEQALTASLAREVTLGERRVAATLTPAALGVERQPALLVVLRDLTAVEQAERGRREYFATLAHEIRTPLTSLTATLDLMLQGTTGPLANKQREYLELAVQASASLKELVDSVLDLEKSQHGGMGLRLRPARIEAIVEQVVARFAPMVSERELTLELLAAPGLPPIPADPLRVEQVVANLLSNAAKFAPSQSKVRVTVTPARRVPGYVVLGVHNVGEEVDPAELAAIFERFRQGRRRAEVGLRGTGLGLAICRAIAEAHGGAALAQSDAAATHFWVALPTESRAASKTGGETPIWIAGEGLDETDAVALATGFVHAGLRVHLLPRDAVRARAARDALGAGVVVSASRVDAEPCVLVDATSAVQVAELAAVLVLLEAERGDLVALPPLAPGVLAVLRGFGWSADPPPAAEPVPAGVLVDFARLLSPGGRMRAPVRAFLRRARAAGCDWVGVARLTHLDAFGAAYGVRQAGLLQAAFAGEVAQAAGPAVHFVLVGGGAALSGPRQAVDDALGALIRQVPSVARLYYRRDDRERGSVRVGANEVPLLGVSTHTLPMPRDDQDLLLALGL